MTGKRGYIINTPQRTMLRYREEVRNTFSKSGNEHDEIEEEEFPDRESNPGRGGESAES